MGSTGTTSKKASRRKPRQARSKEKVDRVLQASRRILEEEGTTAFNTNRIAQEAGIGVGSLYEYFPNKSAIALRLMEDIEEQETEIILKRFSELSSASLEAAIVSIVGTTFQLYRRHSNLYRALRGITGATRREGIRPLEQTVLQAIRERLEQHKDEIQRPDLELAALSIFYTVESLTFSSTTHQPQLWTDEQWIDEIVAVVQGYLGV